MNVWIKKTFHLQYVPFQLHTVGNEYAVVHILHINRVHTKQVQKSCAFIFRYSVWMNTFWVIKNQISYFKAIATCKRKIECANSHKNLYRKKVGQNLCCIFEQLPVPTTISLRLVLQGTSWAFWITSKIFKLHLMNYAQQLL